MKALDQRERTEVGDARGAVMCAPAITAGCAVVAVCGFIAVGFAAFASRREFSRPPQNVWMARPFRIACLGDSITAGFATTDPATMAWPQQLQQTLDLEAPGLYGVMNFGHNGATLQRQGDLPYQTLAEWPAVLSSNPTHVVVALGTNDAKTLETGGPPNWENDGNTGEVQYRADYLSMISELKQLPTAPTVQLVIPAPVYIDRSWGMNATVVSTLLPSLIRGIAETAGLATPIDLFSPMGGLGLTRPEWFNMESATMFGSVPDGVHPNDAGSRIISIIIGRGLGLLKNIAPPVMQV